MELIQGSPEWHLWRKQGVGGSDIGILMGESDFDTPYGLWLKKTGRANPKVNNWAMQRGTDAEPKIRALYELYVGYEVPPACVEHAEYPFLRCSLDGLNHVEKLLAEFKYPGTEKHEMARQGIVPPCYVGQVQYNLLVTGMKRAHYVSYNGESIEIVAVTPDPAYQEKLIPVVKKFWECVLNDEPPPLTDKDYMLLTEPEAVAVFEEWKRQKLMMMQLDEIFEQVKLKHKERKELLEQARSKIPALLEKHPKILCSGVAAIKKGSGIDVRIKESEEV